MNRDSSVAPSAMAASKDSLWIALHEAPVVTQGFSESDENWTARSTRFGNGKARIRRPVRSPTPIPVSSECARALDKVLPPSKKLAQIKSAQPTTTLPLPEVPNLTELVAGVRDDRPRIFDSTRFPFPPLVRANPVGENTDRVSPPNTDEATPKYDQKKLLASIHSLETKVAELKHLLAEAANTNQYLRQKAFEAESKIRGTGVRSDSALGSISGGSDAGEDKSDAEYRKLMIEKDRIAAQNVELSRTNLAYEEQLQFAIQQHQDFLIQLRATDYENQQLELRNKDLEATVSALRVYEEESRNAQQKHHQVAMHLQATNIENEELELRNKDLKAEVSELRAYVAELMAHQEESIIKFEADPDMTAKDAECDRIMYQREQAANTRQKIKARLRARREQVTEPIPDLPPYISPISNDNQKSQPTSSTHEEPKITIDDVSLPLSLRSDLSGVRQDFEGRNFEEPAVQEESDFSPSQEGSPWIVHHVSIGLSEANEPSVAQVSDHKEEVSGGEQSDESKSTVERVLRTSREAQRSNPIIERNSQNQATQRSLIDGSELNIRQTPATPRSLIDGSELSSHHTPPTPRSLLDEDSQSSVGRGFAALQVRDSLLIAKRNISKDPPVLPSLIDYDGNKSVVVTSDAQQKAKRTKVIRRPVPVSDRMPVPGPYEEEPTIRPSQHPGIALATVLGALESELSELKRSAKKYQQLYENHDAALSKRSRKSLFEKLQKLNKTIDVKADHIYSLYDVLEGQKQCGQEMSQEEVEVTLQSIGIDPDELSWVGSESTGTHSTSSSRRA